MRSADAPCKEAGCPRPRHITMGAMPRVMPRCREHLNEESARGRARRGPRPKPARKPIVPGEGLHRVREMRGPAYAERAAEIRAGTRHVVGAIKYGPNGGWSWCTCAACATRLEANTPEALSDAWDQHVLAQRRARRAAAQDRVANHATMEPTGQRGAPVAASGAA
jgi:hypothetical protein